MNPLTQALSSGFNPSQILTQVLRMFPQHSTQIRRAINQGFSAKQIINFLSGGREKLNQDDSSMTEHEKTSKTDDKRRQNVNRVGAAIGALGLGAGAVGLMGRGANAAIQGQLLPALAQNPQIPNLGGTTINIGHSPIQVPPNPTPTNPNPVGNNPVQPNAQPGIQSTPQGSKSAPINPPQQPPSNQISLNSTQEELNAQPPHPRFKGLDNSSAASIPEPTNIQQSKQNSNIVDRLYSSFEKGRDKGFDFESDAFLKIAKRMKSTGEIRSREDFEKFFNLFDAKKNEGKDLPTALKEASGEYDNQRLTPNEQTAPIEAQEQSSVESPSPQLDETKEVERPKIEKNSVVSSPNGVGEVKEIRNGQALVEVDGKLHKVKEEDLEPPLYSDDEIADAYDNLMAKIPEKERSGFISWAGYDEDRRVLGYIPRGGKYEELTDITPEEAELIKTGKGVARTSGETPEGFWIKGGDTRGLISQIQHDRRRAREKLDKHQLRLDLDIPKPEKEDRGMKPIFDEMAYARNLSRTREKKAKDEERSRKKKEKDEAKKRKK